MNLPPRVTPSELPRGLYELLLTEDLNTRLLTRSGSDVDLAKVEAAESPDVLARHIADAARRAFLAVPPERRLGVANKILAAMDDSDLLPGVVPEQLLAIRDPKALPRAVRRPSAALSDSALLTNAKDEPSLGAELQAELSSADQVDLLCAFVRWQGIRVLEKELTLLHERGVPFRVITTTYIGATERRALDELVAQFGATVHVNYETQSTRLHAKAWLFRRNSGFNTAYVGSSNLSHSALVDGLEWNVRLSQVTAPALLRKFEATFESYWHDTAFEHYDPERDAERLDRALRGGADYEKGSAPIEVSGLEVRPRSYQLEMLEALAAERDIHGRHRNLIIAATGTGKTVVAALDYRALVHKAGRPLTLLFVAHRKEILQQSMRMYREVMMDGAFGELYVDGERPDRWTQVFASIQSLTAMGVAKIEASRYDVVVIDEFHHASADTYSRLISHLAPQELLGLTATPERGDGENVTNTYFDGRAAAELRLWDALEAQILVPFHYFGISDGVDLTDVQWKRGTYDAQQLADLYVDNTGRAGKIIRALQDKVTDVSNMKAIGFCVSVAHAEFMARVFNDANIPAASLTGATSSSHRADILAQLKAGTITTVFAVDILNEGLDIPQVDTILMLRPTQSATIFLQQLGRGLRKSFGKSVLTVLDFIGNQRAEFRFDARYRAVTGIGRAALARQIEDGFPSMPAGSQIVLDPVVQAIVMKNVKSQLNLTVKQLAADVRDHAAGRTGDSYRLRDYLPEAQRELKDVYQKKTTWTALLRESGLSANTAPELERDNEEKDLLGRMAALLHVDDQARSEAYIRIVSPGAPHYDDLDATDQVYARMLVSTLWRDGGGFSTYGAALSRLHQFGEVQKEIAEIVHIASDASRRFPKPLGDELNDVPLLTHATYRREEILAALGWADLTVGRNPGNHREGVQWCEGVRTDALLVTLHKAERRFSPNTMYKDYALNDSLFHWESQNNTSVTSPVGRRYLDRSATNSKIVLFTRHSNEDDDGFVGTFTCLGQVDYVTHTGSKPIGITWQLKRPMPTDVLLSASAVAR
jgi:superfamily II DNA or RNA helicase/HKD family nuclease